MKWFKHVSDSLDDPLIYDLMTEFGSDGYLVFFGVLEKSMLQNPQLRVHSFPITKNVAVFFDQHSKRLGHFASSHTV